MNTPSRAGVAAVAGLGLLLSFGSLAVTQTRPPVAKARPKETALTKDCPRGRLR